MKTMKHKHSMHTQAERQQASIPVVMIRHAPSQWNLEKRFTGRPDPPLTAAGIVAFWREQIIVPHILCQTNAL